LEFKRGTINAAQKAGRRLTKTTTTIATTMPESSNDDDDSDSESDSEGSGLDSNTEETELANRVSTVANALAISSPLLAKAAPAGPRRRLKNSKPAPAPARKHQGQISQVLQKGKGKAVQKQRECGEVHRGPRKLRSMK
jgi:hypothetical protein